METYLLSPMFKNELRQYIKEQQKWYSLDEKAAWSATVVSRLLAHPRLISAQTILLYASLPDEIDTRQAIERLYEQGKRVLLPIVINETEMELCLYHGKEKMREGAFHIMEPYGEAFTDYSSIGVAVIPGMAFDERGNRLGRGKGYYDRILAPLTLLYKIGVCFPYQLVREVPTTIHDIRMDEVISP